MNYRYLEDRGRDLTRGIEHAEASDNEGECELHGAKGVL